MNKEIENLEPKVVWKYFNEILQIPRPSGNLEKITKYIKDFAEKNNLKYKKDKSGNILIEKEASSDKLKNNKTIILQSHLDMVPEKTLHSNHDFKHDPIDAYINDKWVTAKNTTLGADNGIGIAASLAVLASDELKLGKIQTLITADEEIGLIGATAIEKDFIDKDAILLNLDSEDEGEIFVSSAGGFDTEITIPISSREATSKNIFEIGIINMKGGHSGCDIDLNHGNALLVLVDLLQGLNDKTDFNLINIDSGNAPNAIPRFSKASIATNYDKLSSFVADFEKNIKEKHNAPDTEINILERKATEVFAISKKSENNILKLLKNLPNGVLKMSKDMKDLVQTSANVASIQQKENTIKIVISGRSSVSEDQNELKKQISNIVKDFGGSSNVTEEYGGWKADMSSEILNIAKKQYKKLFDTEAKIMAIHAGLECGILKEKYPKLDIISFGPTIKFPHSPDEKMHIESVAKFWKLLINIIQ